MAWALAQVGTPYECGGKERIHLLGPRAGIYGVGDGQAMMAGAPHTGAGVRVEAFPATPGAPCGADVYLGAASPGR